MPDREFMARLLPKGANPQLPPETATTPLTAEQSAVVERVLRQHENTAGPLLPILHDVQDALGYVPSAAVAPIARALQLSRAEVYGVISFYPYFRSHSPARVHIEVCQAESCQAMGALELSRHVTARVGCEMGATNAAKSVSVHPVYCLGLCAQSPALMVNGQPYARMSCERFDALLANLEEAP